MEAHIVLLVEYPVEGMGSSTDIEKIGRLMELLDDLLGQTGLGICDGNSIGSGTMEAACYVVDFEIAKRVIAKALANTEFADYSRIYDEGAD